MALRALRIQDLLFKPEIQSSSVVGSMVSEDFGDDIFDQMSDGGYDVDGSEGEQSPDSVGSEDSVADEAGDDQTPEQRPNIYNPPQQFGQGFGTEEDITEGKYIVYRRPDESITSQSKSELLRQIDLYRKLLGLEDYQVMTERTSFDTIVAEYSTLRSMNMPRDAVLSILRAINKKVDWSASGYDDPVHVHRLIYSVTRDHRPLPPLHIQQDIYVKNIRILGQKLNNILYGKYKNNFARYREVSFTLQLIHLNKRPDNVDKIMRRILIKHLSYALLPSTRETEKLSQQLVEYESQLEFLRSEYIAEMRSVIGAEPTRVMEPTLYSLMVQVARGPDTEFKEQVATPLLATVSNFNETVVIRTRAGRKVVPHVQKFVEERFPDSDHHLRVQFQEVVDKIPTLQQLYTNMKDIEMRIKNLSIDLNRETINELAMKRARLLVEQTVQERGDAYPIFVCFFIVLFNHVGGTSKQIKYMKEKFIAGEFSAQYLASSTLDSTLVPELLTLKSSRDLAMAVRNIYDAAHFLHRSIKERALSILYEGLENDGDIISVGVTIENIKSVFNLCLNDAPDVPASNLVLLPSGERHKFYCMSKSDLRKKIEKGENNPFTGCTFDKDIVFKVKNQ